MNKKKLPPKVTMPNGEVYLPVLIKIQSRYENGVPEDLTLIPDQQVCEITGGEEFLIAYVLDKMLEKTL